MSTGCREQVIELLKKYSLGSPLIDERMMDWLRLFYTYSRADLEAENAAMKEQVARLEDLNRKLCDKTNTLTIQSARLEETITTLQSKSAALVDALEALLSWVDAYAETSDAEFPDVEDKCNAALATFKGEK